MTRVLGVDGCPGGWCCVAIDADTAKIASTEVHPAFERALESPATIICVDIPIGLLDGPGQRACDVEARRLLGRGRASSVFSPPSRRSLSFEDYREASDVNFPLTERRLSKQSFNISPKVRQVDHAIKPAMQDRVREVHPELCFRALNGDVAMPHNKKTLEGREERWRLLREVLLDLDEAPALPKSMRGRCGLDDYIDALVCAWTAVCILRREAACIPTEPEFDRRGLRMEMWLPGAWRARAVEPRYREDGHSGEALAAASSERDCRSGIMMD
jgi:predicted RNase H-like nuclease